MIFSSIMANLVRPVLPALALTPEDAAPRSRDTTTTISTRRTSAHGSVQKPTTPARSSRKRPLPDDATPDARPPTKITVTQPHGELLRTTNGVAAPLGIGADEIPSRPGSAGNIAPAAGCSSSKDKEKDKRSLRSHDGGSRLKSDLATYFSSYEDIIAGVPKPAGMFVVVYRERDQADELGEQSFSISIRQYTLSTSLSKLHPHQHRRAPHLVRRGPANAKLLLPPYNPPQPLSPPQHT